ncbi:hypothetical protein ACFWXO_18735 [Kitasatospora sp. NPDC059088]|uniref:hypothetical protein n=1 Tax=Kitasatospora sp. NPDC059088 TaxID=3346722 RepID=UPI003677118D
MGDHSIRKTRTAASRPPAVSDDNRSDQFNRRDSPSESLPRQVVRAAALSLAGTPALVIAALVERWIAR